jgi:hypothetical protein
MMTAARSGRVMRCDLRGGAAAAWRETGQCPGSIGHADVTEGEEDGDSVELRAHERKEFVVAVGEAGVDADVLDDVSNDEGNGGEGKNAAEAVVLRSVNEGEGEGGEDFEGDDWGGWGVKGKNFDHSAD